VFHVERFAQMFHVEHFVHTSLKAIGLDATHSAEVAAGACVFFSSGHLRTGRIPKTGQRRRRETLLADDFQSVAMILKVWRGRPRPRDGVQWQLRPFDFAQGRLRGAWSGSTLTPDFRPGLSPSAPLRLPSRLRSGLRQNRAGIRSWFRDASCGLLLSCFLLSVIRGKGTGFSTASFIPAIRDETKITQV
jgi:hypothetical protein